jgi:hypothetical protein
MNASVKALEALVTQFGAADSNELMTELRQVVTGPSTFMERVKLIDSAFEKHRDSEPVHEYVFDLLMSYHLEENNEQEEYFESKEWLDIEDKTLNRGTELLNILLYINESRNEDVDVSIEDFLYEFLLVDEDEFQDEHRIYEDIIVNQDLVEESIDSILAVSKRIDETSGVYELFVPLMLFFREPDEKNMTRETHHKLKPMERALLSTLLTYRNGI